MAMTAVTPETLYRKLVDSHTVARLDQASVLLYADLHMMNEYTSPQAFSALRGAGRTVAAPRQQIAVVDHVVPTHPDPRRAIQDPASAALAGNLAGNCRAQGIMLFDAEHPLQGIEHVVAPELGMIRPGMVVVCGDSHTTTYGALGALGFGIGTSEVEHVLATQTLAYSVARDMRVRIDGKLPFGTSAKDLVLYLISRIGAAGARGYAVELCGDTIGALSVEARMTLCNMAVEAGARAALIAPDSVTIDYVLARASDIDGGLAPLARQEWQSLRSDNGARFETEHRVNASWVEPYVSWGTSPDQAIPVTGVIPAAESASDPRRGEAIRRALSYMGLQAGARLEGTAVQRVFIGSCTNGRIEDLRAAAEVARGRKVSPSVRAMVVPGSGAVRRQAETEGIADLLVEAGFEWRQPGCSMCLAMNDDVLGPGERCASTTNRNFEGRQGRGGRTHLMSPAMAAAAAVTGQITDVRRLGDARG